jgi:hypothetical protein
MQIFPREAIGSRGFLFLPFGTIIGLFGGDIAELLGFILGVGVIPALG